VLTRLVGSALLATPLATVWSIGAAWGAQPPIAYVSDGGGALDVWLVDASGANKRKLTDSRSDNINPAWSPNAKQIAWASTRTGTVNIYVMNADGTGQRALTTSKRGSSSAPAWSPDGKLIAFESNRDGNWEIYVMNADGTGERNVSRDGDDDFRPSWAPDSRRLVYQRTSAKTSQLVVTDATTPAPRVLPTPGAAANPAWSPDGKLIAYDAFANRNYDVWLTDPEGTLRRRITTSPAEDSEPAFSGDSKSLVFTSTRDDNYDLYSTDLLGRGQTNLTKTRDANELDPDWAPLSRARLPARSLRNNPPNAGWACTQPASVGGGVITGTSGTDTLCGTASGETLKALQGDDRMVGKGSADKYWGGPGGDKFWSLDCVKDSSWGATPTTTDLSRADLSHRDSFDVEQGIDGHF
jgi:Tol biopolymer transport system component